MHISGRFKESPVFSRFVSCGKGNAHWRVGPTSPGPRLAAQLDRDQAQHDRSPAHCLLLLIRLFPPPFVSSTRRDFSLLFALASQVAIPQTLAAAAMPFTPGPYSGVSTLALVSASRPFLPSRGGLLGRWRCLLWLFPDRIWLEFDDDAGG